MLSIAQRHGYLWENLWNDPANRELQALRQDPNVLLAGDVVHLPEKESKEEQKPTDTRHRFEVDGNLAKFKIRILVGDKPLQEAPYQLRLPGGDVRAGQLDGDGFLTEDIPPDVTQGELVVGPTNNQMVWGLQFGGLDPIQTPTGVEQRLVQVGFDAQTTLQERIQAFQRKHKLEESGAVDGPTQSLLEKEFGQ